MTYEPFYNQVAYSLLIICFILAVPVIIVTIVSKSEKVLGVMKIALPLLALAIMASLLATKATPTHDQNMRDNIAKKYDIAFIVDDNPKYKIYPQEASEQLVLIETKDGRQGVFSLTQNRFNFEPTLSELAEEGTAVTVTLEDITK